MRASRGFSRSKRYSEPPDLDLLTTELLAGRLADDLVDLRLHVGEILLRHLDSKVIAVDEDDVLLVEPERTCLLRRGAGGRGDRDVLELLERGRVLEGDREGLVVEGLRTCLFATAAGCHECGGKSDNDDAMQAAIMGRAGIEPATLGLKVPCSAN